VVAPELGLNKAAAAVSCIYTQTINPAGPARVLIDRYAQIHILYIPLISAFQGICLGVGLSSLGQHNSICATMLRSCKLASTSHSSTVEVWSLIWCKKRGKGSFLQGMINLYVSSPVKTSRPTWRAKISTCSRVCRIRYCLSSTY